MNRDDYSYSIDIEEIHGEVPAEPRQQLAEILGLSWFLEQQLELLLKKEKEEELSDKENLELLCIQEALRPASEWQLSNLNTLPTLHNVEASIRLRSRFRIKASLTKADLIQIGSMELYPEDKLGVKYARRAAYLHAIIALEMATLNEMEEYNQLFPSLSC